MATEEYEPEPGEQRPERTCNECRFALFEDEGYSNWTVEGTNFYCLIGAHPKDGFDRWYGDDKRLWFGVECSRFEVGEPICMDVEEEEKENLSAEQKALYEAWVRPETS